MWMGGGYYLLRCRVSSLLFARTLAHGCDHILVHVQLDRRSVVHVVVIVVVVVVVIFVLAVIVAVGHIHDKL